MNSRCLILNLRFLHLRCDETTRPVGSPVRRTLSLPQSGRQVLGAVPELFLIEPVLQNLVCPHQLEDTIAHHGAAAMAMRPTGKPLIPQRYRCKPLAGAKS